MIEGLRFFVWNWFSFLILQRSSGLAAIRIAMKRTVFFAAIVAVILGIAEQDEAESGVNSQVLMVFVVDLLTTLMYVLILRFMLRKRRQRWNVFYYYISFMMAYNITFNIGEILMLLEQGSHKCFFVLGNLFFPLCQPP
eukprot:UN00622